MANRVPWTGIPPMGGETQVPRRVGTIGIWPSNLELSLAFYGAVFDVLGVSPEDHEASRNWGGMLLVRRDTCAQPTQGADAFLEAENLNQVHEVVKAVRAAGFDTVKSEPESDEEGMTWVMFPDPDGNRVWVTFTAS